MQKWVEVRAADMTRDRTIFLAFAGQAIEQAENIFEIQEGFECWNLKKIEFNDCIEMLKNKIPPVNNNVLRNYKMQDGKHDMYGITEK
jgi:hypothetical protein